MLIRVLFVAGATLAFLGCSSNEVQKKVVEQYPDGKAKKVNYYIGDAKNVVRAEVICPNGKLQQVMHFKKGKKDSTFAMFYCQNGKKYREVNYVNDMPEGKDVSWFEDGRVKSEITYINGLAEGLSVQFDATGNKLAECSFKAGKKDGEERVYAAVVKKPGTSGAVTTAMSSGGSGSEVILREVTTWSAGMKNGLHKKFRKNGTPDREETYVNDVLNGSFTTYWENGKKMEEGYYKDGNYEGDRIQYGENGRMQSKAAYKDGKMVGGQSY